MIGCWCPNCMKYIYVSEILTVNKCNVCGFDLLPIWDKPNSEKSGVWYG